MEGTIERIRVYPEKGSAGVDKAEARLVENSGLEGDFHAKGGDRQLSLLFAETREQITEQKEKGLCFSRFKENISVRGMPPNELRPGVLIEIGEAVLEVTGETKYCHDECPLFEKGKTCALTGTNLFARVLKSGVICTGQKLALKRV